MSEIETIGEYTFDRHFLMEAKLTTVDAKRVLAAISVEITSHMTPQRPEVEAMRTAVGERRRDIVMGKREEYKAGVEQKAMIGTQVPDKLTFVEWPATAAGALTGTNIDLSKGSLDKRPTVVIATGTWCPPCNAVLPRLKEMVAKYPGAQFVLAFSDELKAADLVNKKLDDLTGKDGTRPNVKGGIVADLKAWNVTAFPTFRLVDGAGKQVLTVRGARDGGLLELEKAIEELLARQPR